MLKKFMTAMVVAGGFAGAYPFLIGAAGGDAATTPAPLTPAAMEPAASSAPDSSSALAKEILGRPDRVDAHALVVIRREATVKRGGTLMDALTGAGIPRAQAYDAINALSKTLDPRKVKAGQQIRLTFAKPAAARGKAALSEIALPTGFGREAVVERTASGGFGVSERAAAAQSLYAYAEGTIEDSLYLEAVRNGVPVAVVTEMIHLFSFDVDFQREIWPGTGFSVFYRRKLTADGEAEPGGEILAATLVIKGKALTFYRHDEPGGPEFYTADGQSARKLLMKTPIDGARLSSRYGMRHHPVLGYSRMHKGLDFAAGRGTPIYAAGNGTVEQASRNGGYGNYVKIRHNSTYSTGYAHLNGYARGIRSGARVKQGQVIGYVGSTGLATGPHLHYEVYMNGNQVNPLSLKFPKQRTLVGAELGAFTAAAEGYNARAGAIRAFYAGEVADEERRAALSAVLSQAPSP